MDVNARGLGACYFYGTLLIYDHDSVEKKTYHCSWLSHSYRHSAQRAAANPSAAASKMANTRSRTSSLASTSTKTDGKIDLTVKSVKSKKSGSKARTTAQRRAKKIDGMKPKKPPTAFFYFLEDFRKEYQEQNPDVKSMRDIGKACGEKWKTMTYEGKVKYYDIATEKRAEFDTAMANFIKRRVKKVGSLMMTAIQNSMTTQKLMDKTYNPTSSERFPPDKSPVVLSNCCVVQVRKKPGFSGGARIINLPGLKFLYKHSNCSQGQGGGCNPGRQAEEEEKSHTAHEAAATIMAAAQLIDVDLVRLNKTILCYAETIYRFNGLWEGPDPLTPLISLFLIQLTVSMIVIHLLVFALKPFNQPAFVAEILGGILLGPSALGRITPFRKLLFPNYSFKVLEPMAHLSITYYAFLVGLKMDVKAILRTGTKATKVSIAGIVVPFIIGSGLYFVFDTEHMYGSLFWGSALSVTGFSVLTRILDRQQILHTEIGKTAASSALISDMCAWGFLALSLAVTGSSDSAHWSFIGTIAFVLLCVYYVRPALSWIIRKTPEGQGYSEFYICSILTGMSLSGVVTDIFGTHPMIGAFVFGLVIPSEVLEATITDKLEDFVVGILLPVYFVVCGLRTNIDLIASGSSWIVVGLVILLACSVKLFSALLVAAFSELPVNEAMAVGLLSNAKSVLVLIILETGQIQGGWQSWPAPPRPVPFGAARPVTRGGAGPGTSPPRGYPPRPRPDALKTQTYSIMVVAVLVMTMIVTPAVLYYKPVQNTVPYKRRTIQKAKSDEELRILACIYNTRNVPTVINLLRTSNASPRSPITVYALQLVELVGRASTMLVAHSSRKAGPRNPSQIEAQADQIIAAFDNYELRSEGVITHTYTARSAFAAMDEDICNVARDKRAALIILPFHRQQTIDGDMEDINPSIRNVNEGVLANASCSVGILIDRGSAEAHDHATNVAVLYFGGPDDREALGYAWRMADNTDVRLTVVRFIPSADTYGPGPMEQTNEKYEVSVEIDYEKEKLLDDDYLALFKTATMESNSISYFELVLNDEEEAIKAIKSMDEHNHDLYVVGRGRGMESPLTSGLSDWCDCPELGPIGDLLVTSEFESRFSVLIVQQYVKSNKSREGSIRSASSANFGDDIGMRPSVTGSDGFQEFGSFRDWDHEN
ncbi:cation/H(+) antiporter 15 [Phtheirospermum japonicum]|uniref:Cation/H(+) antiporter 15 n=1 Tax=Phtheirospermum japonicum TaxID=374723 RepID=A0A830B201_9LAMI|nr:cation/H(+) antiporter 15 [Phtheirospermum japonicum]